MAYNGRVKQATRSRGQIPIPTGGKRGWSTKTEKPTFWRM